MLYVCCYMCDFHIIFFICFEGVVFSSFFFSRTQLYQYRFSSRLSISGYIFAVFLVARQLSIVEQQILVISEHLRSLLVLERCSLLTTQLSMQCFVVDYVYFVLFNGVPIHKKSLSFYQLHITMLIIRKAQNIPKG